MSRFQLDDIDKKIPKELRDDDRIPNVELSDRVGLSPAPCLFRSDLSELLSTHGLNLIFDVGAGGASVDHGSNGPCDIEAAAAS
jgi:hypothetical protein